MAEVPASHESTLHFQVHPSVLFKLGQDLIRDNGQALAELIKNSYDADATVVRVNIDTKDWFDRRTGEVVSRDAGAVRSPDWVQGRITVTDDGSGMDLAAIERGWLTVSYSQKLEMKQSGRRTSGGRTPLGDKGLGRLGVQRLGDAILLDSTSGAERVRAMIDWADYGGARTLAEVPVVVQASATVSRPGTTVAVLGLHEPEYWSGRGALALQRELTTILSPYDAADGLSVFVTIDDEPLDLRSQARAVLDAASIRYNFSYADGKLEIEALTSAQVLGEGTNEVKRLYRSLIAPDNGHRFSEWLLSGQSKRAIEVGATAGDDRFFVTAHSSRRLADVVPDGVLAADPGPFSGEISSLSWSQRPDDTVFDLPSELKSFAQSLTGIRVYRDGFGIRLDADWLGLSRQQTTGSSCYGLRPGNTTGYVNISAGRNASLEETSSREAFIDNPAWQGFYWLMRAVADYARKLQEFIRRGWNEYRAIEQAGVALQEFETPAELAAHVESELARGVALSKRTAKVRNSAKAIDRAVSAMTTARATSDDSIWNDPSLDAALESTLTELTQVRIDISGIVEELESISAEQSDLHAAVRLLREKLSAAEAQISRAWESVALGLSAEVFSHEVDNIAERLRGRSSQLGNYLASLPEQDQRVLAFVEHVRASSVELSRQSSRLQPALRYRRERKETHRVSALVSASLEYHQTRWQAESIVGELVVVSDFSISVNEGKFTQIMDNLLLNSEYWVRRAINQGDIDSGLIRCEIDVPFLRVSDNGPGIAPGVAASLFDPFVTTKPGDDGRGLGLFVVRQLLDSEKATIRLTESIGKSGRPATFELDLRSLMPRGGSN